MAQQLRVKRGSNGANIPGRKGPALGSHEMAALDDLGPMTRKVLVDGPLSILASSIVSQIIEYNDKIEAENLELQKQGKPLKSYLDPKHPALDRKLAEGALALHVQMIATDRSIEDAKIGLKPLVPKLSARSARERRKTEGRRFRGW